MTNIYFLYRGASPPSPYQVKATWDGKYIRFGSHGTTGGSSTHTHTGSNKQCSSAPSSSNYIRAAGSFEAMKSHTHSISESISSQNNDPSYYTLSLIYMDLAEWELSERRIPKDAVILSEASLAAWTEVARLSVADGKLIKLGTPGSVGGNVNHSHVVSGSLSSGGNYFRYVNQDFCDVGEHWYASHTHTLNFSSSSKTIFPARMQTRLYYALATTLKAQSGIIAFVDAPPSANWAIVSWDNNFLESADVNAVQTGSNTHDHLAASGNSSSYGNAFCTQGMDNDGPYQSSHQHQVTLDLQSASNQPLYVNLYPVKLLNTLVHEVTYTKTWNMDALASKSKPKTFEMQATIRRDDEITYPVDGLVQTSFEKTFNASAAVCDIFNFAWNADALLKRVPTRSFRMRTSMFRLQTDWAMSAIMTKPFVPTSIIDSLARAYVTQFDSVQQEIQSMEWANKIENAIDNNLDDRWGKVYKLPRRQAETDEAYRKRLQTNIGVITGSATKSTCENTLDTIVDEPGGSLVESYWPATVRVDFVTDKALRNALKFRSLIESTLDRMLAAGVSYFIYLSFLDFSMSAHLAGVNSFGFYMDAALMSSFGCTFNLDARIVDTDETDFEMDALVQKEQYLEYLIGCTLKRTALSQFNLSTRIMTTNDESIYMSVLLKISKSTGLPIDAIIQKIGIPKSITMDTRMTRSFSRVFFMSSQLVIQGEATVNMSARIKKFDALKSFWVSAKLLSHKSTGWQMSTRLVTEQYRRSDGVMVV